MLIAGLGLGVATVAVSVAILTGARPDETGMIYGLNSTGHEIGGTLGIAVFTTFAAGAGGAIIGPHAVNGISHAFLAGAGLAVLASLIALPPCPGQAPSSTSCASRPRCPCTNHHPDRPRRRPASTGPLRLSFMERTWNAAVAINGEPDPRCNLQNRPKQARIANNGD